MSGEIVQAASKVADLYRQLREATERAERAEVDAVALYEAAREYLDCGCSHGVHWVDVEGEAESEVCDLYVELDDRLRAFAAAREADAATKARGG